MHREGSSARWCIKYRKFIVKQISGIGRSGKVQYTEHEDNIGVIHNNCPTKSESGLSAMNCAFSREHPEQLTTS
jgi:hypothetical protein